MYHIRKKDKALFKNWLKQLKQTLKKYYQGLNSELTEAEKNRGKEAIFSDYLKEKRVKFQRYDYIGKDSWNNAEVLGRSLYAPDLKRFYRSYNCSGQKTAGSFLKFIEKQASENSDKDLFLVLDSMCR